MPVPSRSEKPLAAPTTANIAALEARLPERELRSLDQAAQELEGVFLRLVMRQMERAQGSGGLFGQTAQSRFMGAMAYGEMGDALAGGSSGGLGLGRMVYEVLVRDAAAKSQAANSD